MAFVEAESASSAPVAPSGWTQLDSAHNGSYYASTFVHVITASNPSAQYTFTSSSGAILLVTLLAYTGVDGSNPVDAHGLTLTPGSPSTVPSPTITTTAANDTVALIDSFACNASGTHTLPTGMQQIADWRWSTDSQERVAGQEDVSQPGQVSAPMPVSGCGTWPYNTTASALIALRSVTPPAPPDVGKSWAKPLFRSASTVLSVSPPMTIGVPQGAQPGDVLLAEVAGNATQTAPQAPTGWTALDTAPGVTTLNPQFPGKIAYQVATYYHVVAAGDPSSYTFTATPVGANVGSLQGQILDYTHVNQTSPIDAHTLVEDWDGPQTVTALGGTTTSANERLVEMLYFRFYNAPQNGSGTVTPPAGATSRNYQYNQPDDSYTAAFDEPFPSGGPTSYQSFQLNAGTAGLVDPRFAALITLKPGPRTVATGQDASRRGGCNPALPGFCSLRQSVGKPINTENGDFWETSTDAKVATFGPPLAFSRTYDSSLAQAQSASGTPGGLGYGWSDNWQMSLSVNSGTVTINQGNGAVVNFDTPTNGACSAPDIGSGAAGTFCALPYVTASLTYNSSTGVYTFVTHPYMSYTFNSAGQLTGESGPGGATLSLAYNSPAPGTGNCPGSANSCLTVTSASGRALVIGSNSSGLVTSVTDALGRTWNYGYCTPPSSTCSSGDLVRVTDPRGKVTTYTYDQGNANTSLVHDLLTVTRPNGQPGGPDAGDALTNAYNSSGQVSSQADPAGNRTTFDYSNLDSSATGYTLVTDPDGNQTKYSYDNGVLVGRTLGYGSPSPSTWTYRPDSSTLLDDEIIDPNGNETDYLYNGNGDLVEKINPLGAVWSYSYNSFDQQTCAALPLATTQCPSLSPPAAIPAGSSTIAPPSTVPPKYVTYTEYDTNGNPIWTTTGDYNPGGSSASQSRTTYQLHSGQSVTLGSSHDSCTASAPNSSLPCATINPDGVVTQLGYDNSGDVNSSATPDGNPGGEKSTTTSVFDADGEPTSVTAPKGNLAGANAATYTTTYDYNGDGQLHSKTVSQTGGGITARTTTYGYDDDGNLSSVTDPRLKTTTYTYTPNDQRTLTTDPDNQQTLTCYDGDGNIAQTVPAVGVAANSLAPASCPSNYPSAYGNRLAADATTYSYDPLGDKTVVTTPAPAGQTGHETTTNAYDLAGRLTSVTAPPASNDPSAPNQVNTYGYDSADELTRVTRGSGTAAASTTSYCYDPNGDKTATVAPDGNTSGVATCATTAPYQTTSNYQTGYNYDSLGELVSETRPATSAAPSGQTTSYTYDPAGNLLTSADPSDNITRNSYDPLGQLTQAATYPASADYVGSVGTEHPAAFWQLDETSGTSAADSSGNGHTATYQGSPSLGQPPLINTGTAANFNGSNDANTGWNSAFSANNKLSIEAWIKTSASGAYQTILSSDYGPSGPHYFQFRLNSTGHLELLLFASNGTSYTFSSNAAVNDGRTHQVAAAFDGSTIALYIDGQQDSTFSQTLTLPTTGSTLYIGTRIGSTGLRTDYFNGTLDEVSLYTSALSTAQIQHDYGAGTGTPTVTSSFTYDANGNRVSMSDASGNSTYQYDPFNELTSRQNGAGKTLTYTYNQDGETSGITYPLGSGASWATSDTVSYGYDNADELNSITDFNGNTITIGSTADGLPNSLSLGSTGDTITTTYDATDTPSEISLGNGTSTPLDLAYSDVPSGAINSETTTPTTSTSPAGYAYDAQNRVTQMTPGSGSTLNYGFDASGNLTTLPTGASGSYDHAAELTNSTLGPATTTLTYNSDGERLQASQGGSTIASASYNSAQQVTSYSSTAANMSSATYDGDNLRTSTTTTPTGGSATTQNYLWDTSGATPQLVMDSTNAYIYGPGTAPLEQVNLNNGAITYLLADRLGSIRGTVNASGSLTNTTSYHAWGNPQTAGGLTSSTPFGYAGNYTDPTGLTYNIRRYYDPQTGQFISVDPAVDQTEAPYAYASGDPVDTSDPLGLWGWNPIDDAESAWKAVNPLSTSNVFYGIASRGGAGASILGLNPFLPAAADFVGAANACSSGAKAEDILAGIGWTVLGAFNPEDEAEITAVEADQAALRDLVNEMTHGGRKPLSVEDANAVLDWGGETKYPGLRAEPGDVANPSNWRANPVPHIHVPGAGRGGHVPVDPGVNPIP